MEVTRGATGLTRPEVLFLDVGDTLIRAHPSWAGVYRLGLLEAGVDIAEKDLERALLEETKEGGWWLDETPFEPTEAKSFETVMAFDAAVLARLGHGDLGERAFRRIEDAFARRAAWYVFPDVPMALDALTAAGIRLCVISNFVWGLPELIHDLELARHFERLVVSARVGFQKPNPGIFQHALDVMRVAPEQAMHVGDSYRADVIGARKLGIGAALIARGPNDPARLRDEHSDPDLLVLSDLNDLLEVFAIERPVASPA